MKKVIIIGGGIVGLSCAYFLKEEGFDVCIIDKENIINGASYVNAGYISPSHIIPLAAPGIITKGLKWMLNPASPFYVKPRLEADFLNWFWAFKKSATKAKVEKGIPVMKDITLLSQELYQSFQKLSDFDFFYKHKGLLMLYQTEKAGEEEWNVGQRAIKEGLQVENLNLQQVQKLEPKIDVNVKGAVYYHCDSHMTPHEFMPQFKAYLERKGVQFINEEVVDVVLRDHQIDGVFTKSQVYKADEIVLASGSWTSILAKKLGLNLLLEAGKGYRINLPEEQRITIPAILMERKVAITPMNGFTRLAGTMEIGGINHQINPVRVNAIANAAKSYYPTLEIKEQNLQQAQCGLRPLSPDGLPYIGKSSKVKNLTIATGHAMMGWSLGPATGKLVSELIANKKTSLDCSPFAIERKF